jgi:hypothetical protein
MSNNKRRLHRVSLIKLTHHLGWLQILPQINLPLRYVLPSLSLRSSNFYLFFKLIMEQIAIENAKTMEEVQKVERMIKAGKSHEDTPMADT